MLSKKIYLKVEGTYARMICITHDSEGIFIDQDIVLDKNLFSGKGLGRAFKFAFTLAKLLNMDKKEVNFQAEHIYISY